MSSSEVYAPRARRPRRRHVIRDEPADVVAAAASLRRLPRELPVTGPGGAFLGGLAAIVHDREKGSDVP